MKKTDTPQDGALSRIIRYSPLSSFRCDGRPLLRPPVKKYGKRALALIPYFNLFIWKNYAVREPTNFTYSCVTCICVYLNLAEKVTKLSVFKDSSSFSAVKQLS